MRAVAILITLFLASCANPAQQAAQKQLPERIVKSASGKLLCGVHGIPLTTIHGYCTPGLIGCSMPLEKYQQEIEEHNPNFIPHGESPSRTKECTVPTLITYCRWCEAAYQGENFTY